MTHKSEDYKISAVKYYLKNKDNIRKTCKIFDCKKSTLQRWIQSMKKQYPTFDITPQHLGQVVRDNNQTRKITRHEHFPKERYKMAQPMCLHTIIYTFIFSINLTNLKMFIH